jgi:hypothetical protein
MVVKCIGCGHVERCCYVYCPVCGEDMVQIEQLKQNAVLEQLKEKVGDPIYPESLLTQCKFCGKRKPLFLVTEAKLKGGLQIGICKECYTARKD